MSDDTDVTSRPDDVHDDGVNPEVGDDSSAGPLDGLDESDDGDSGVDPFDVPSVASPPAVDSNGGEAGDNAVNSSSEDRRAVDMHPVVDEGDVDEVDVDEVEEGAAAGPDKASGQPRSTGSRVRVLEREGEVAADFLERLLDIADLDGDIEVDIDGDRASVAIVDSEDGRVPRRLVGSEGKVLDALQELTRLAVQAETGERSRLMLDIAGHRAQRRAIVVEIAQSAISDVKTSGSKRALDDMSAFERKIVHDEVAAAGLSSESEGVEPHRHIVVFPA
jgi:spoIIIJ-associated protein